jgi:hypothetical protein
MEAVAGRRLNSPHLLPAVYAGKQFVNGEMVTVMNNSERNAA